MLDFSKIEGLDSEQAKALEVLTKADAFTNYVTKAVQNREEAARVSAETPLKAKVDEFRTNNKNMEAKLKAFDGFDAEEYNRLKALGSDSSKAAQKIKDIELEWQTKHETTLKSLEETKQALTEKAQALETEKFSNEFNRAIDAYDAANPTMKIAPTARAAIIRDAQASYKVVNDKYVMMSGDKEFTNDSGFGGMDEWIGKSYVQANPHVVDRTGGSGASGSASGGAPQNRSSVDKIRDGLSA